MEESMTGKDAGLMKPGLDGGYFIPDPARDIRALFDIADKDIRSYSPLTLAFLGDSVYEMIIRSLVSQKYDLSAGKLNREKVRYVNAAAQAMILDSVFDELTEDEQKISKSGRNAKSRTSAKNQQVTDYRKATGFEALCGYLYLSGRVDRLYEIVQKGVKLLDEKNGK